MTSNRSSWLILGAGPSGLANARVLKKLSIPFDLVEKSGFSGGIWDHRRKDTPIYSTTHFISSKTMSTFRDFPMPEDYPDYPSHEQILAYIRNFSAANGLESAIRFNTEVTDLAPLPGGGWNATFDHGEQREYQGVIVANGRNWYPNWPDYTGSFSGEIIHSKDYQGPDQLKGKRVLIVGGGNSACDIACDAAMTAEQTWISMRRGYHFIPKHVFGIPSDVFANQGPHLPLWLERPVFRFLLNKLLIGDLRRYGLPKPDHPLFASHPIMNTRILHHLSHGDLQYLPDIKVLDGSRVHFSNGQSIEPDLIIYATGYNQVFPFLRSEVFSWNPDQPDLFLNIFSRQYANLLFAGFVEADGAAFPLISLQADLIGAYLSQQIKDPVRWQKFRDRCESERPDLSGGIKHLPTARHAHYTQSHLYAKVLKKEFRRLDSNV